MKNLSVLVLDNYDSFTYNLVHILQQLPGLTVDVYRNDKISIEAIDSYDRILLSPGPGIPEEAGIMLDVVKRYAGKKPILGVCLGHQGIGEVFGAKLKNLSQVMHGVATPLILNVKDEPLFDGIESGFMVGRYHSWVVDNKELPDTIEITATDADGQIMALRHKQLNIRGVQFHPESVLTEHGFQIIKNWIELC